MSSGANFKFLAEKMDLDKVSVVSWDYPAQGLATLYRQYSKTGMCLEQRNLLSLKTFCNSSGQIAYHNTRPLVTRVTGLCGPWFGACRCLTVAERRPLWFAKSPFSCYWVCSICSQDLVSEGRETLYAAHASQSSSARNFALMKTPNKSASQGAKLDWWRTHGRP